MFVELDLLHTMLALRKRILNFFIQIFGIMNSKNWSQSELALVLGLHRSTVCRIIRTLRDRGVLGHFTRCSLEILDREALAELCNPSEGGK